MLRALLKKLSGRSDRKGRGKATRIVKRLPVKHSYQGKARNLVVEIDLEKSTVSVRLSGCRTRKTYLVEDLFCWGAQTTFL